MKMVQNLYYKSLTEYYGLSAGICALNPNVQVLFKFEGFTKFNTGSQ